MVPRAKCFKHGQAKAFVKKQNHIQRKATRSLLHNEMIAKLKSSHRTISLTKDKNWAATPENLSSGCCEQQRRRTACAYAQSDQRLCFSLFDKYHIQACHKRNFNFLAEQTGLSLALSDTPKTGFVATRPKYKLY